MHKSILMAALLTASMSASAVNYGEPGNNPGNPGNNGVGGPPVGGNNGGGNDNGGGFDRGFGVNLQGQAQGQIQGQMQTVNVGAPGASATTSSSSTAAGGQGGLGGQGGIGQGGQGGVASLSTGPSSTSFNIDNRSPAPLASTQSTVTQRGGYELKTVGVAPDIMANPTAPCRVAVGASGGWLGGALGLTGSILDEGCDTRADATMLLAMNQPEASLRRLCQKPEMAEALGAGTCPQNQKVSFWAQKRDAEPVARPGTQAWSNPYAKCRNVPDRQYAACMREARR